MIQMKVSGSKGEAAKRSDLPVARWLGSAFNH